MAKTSGVWSVLAALVALTSMTGCFDGPSFGSDYSSNPTPTLPQNNFGRKLFQGEVVRSQGKVAPISGGTLLVTKDGHAVASDPDRDQVYVVDVGAKSVVTVPLTEGDEPGRVVEGATGTAYVAMRRGGAVAVIDIAGGTATRIPVCAAPRGLAYDDASSSLYVTCRSGLLARVDTTNNEVKDKYQLDGDLRDVLISGDNLVVSRFKNAEVMVVSRSGEVLRRTVPKAPNNAMAALTPRVAYRTLAAPSGAVLVGHVDSSNVQLPSGAGAYYGAPCGGSVADLSVSLLDPNDPGGAATPQPTIKTQSSQALGGVSGPMDLAFTADGSKVAILATGNAWSTDGSQKNNLFVAPSTTLTNNGLGITCGASVGVTPATAHGEPVAVAFDEGNNWIVQSREPAQLELQNGNVISLAPDSRADTGMQMFHVNTGGGISCQSCHPEAAEDGHTWNFSVGPRRSQDLRGGASGRAPFHWSGDLVDFDHLFEEVMMKRMSLAADVTPEQKAALRDWIDSVPAELTADDLDAEAVERGRVLFNNEQVGCATCHGGADYTDNLLHDVGTGGFFITPSLVGINSRAPLFHDGCALTLTSRFGVCGGGDNHGVTSKLTNAERDDLVTYMRSL
jgi:mono/diheme cytochrome c family protein